MNYYQKHYQLCTRNEDWKRQPSQFEILCEKYKTYHKKRIAQFENAIKTHRSNYLFCQKLRKMEKMRAKFELRYHKKKSKCPISLKILMFNNLSEGLQIQQRRFQKGNLWTGKLLCLAPYSCHRMSTNPNMQHLQHYYVQYNNIHGLFHVLKKYGVEHDYPSAGGNTTEQIQKPKIYGTYSKTYSNNISKSSFPTLENVQQPMTNISSYHPPRMKTVSNTHTSICFYIATTADLKTTNHTTVKVTRNVVKWKLTSRPV